MPKFLRYRFLLASLFAAFVANVHADASPPPAAELAAAVPAAQLPDILTGIWWNPNESGWGIHLTQRKDTVFAVWYTYDPYGQARWMVASNCHMTAPLACPSCVANVQCSGSLFEANGARFFNQTFDPSTVHLTLDGTLSLDFHDANNATMSYQLKDLNRTLPISRQIFQGGFTPPPVNYTDLWWNPNESGWGLGLTQQYGVMFVTWFVYEGTTRPTWLVASDCVMTANNDGCSGTLYTTDGPPGPMVSSEFDPSVVRTTPVGSVSLFFTDANNGILSWQIFGSGLVEQSTGSKVITRDLF
ncbi:MAG: hypothetical protein ACXWAC_07915 [Usitatibacter sp.]